MFKQNSHFSFRSVKPWTVYKSRALSRPVVFGPFFVLFKSAEFLHVVFGSIEKQCPVFFLVRVSAILEIKYAKTQYFFLVASLAVCRRCKQFGYTRCNIIIFQLKTKLWSKCKQWLFMQLYNEIWMVGCFGQAPLVSLMQKLWSN